MNRGTSHSNPKALEKPARLFPSASRSNRNICAACQSTGPDLCFESKQGSPSTPRFALTHPSHALAHGALLEKLQFAQGKPNPSKPSPSQRSLCSPSRSDQGQLALPNTFAALNQGQILNIHNKCVPWDKQDVWRSSGTHQEAGTNGPMHTLVLHPHLISWCLKIHGHH